MITSKKMHLVLPLVCLSFFTLSACHTVSGTVNGAEQDIRSITPSDNTSHTMHTSTYRSKHVVVKKSNGHMSKTTVIKDKTMHTKNVNTSNSDMNGNTPMNKDSNGNPAPQQ